MDRKAFMAGAGSAVGVAEFSFDGYVCAAQAACRRQLRNLDNPALDLTARLP